MSDVQHWARRPDPARPALLHAGRAEDWWLIGTRAIWLDGEDLWVETAEAVARIGVTPPVWGITVGDRWVGHDSADLEIRVEGDAVTCAQRIRTGEAVTCHRPLGADWQCSGRVLPEGARRARSVVPYPAGSGVVWASEGFVYRLGHTLRPVGRGSAFRVGPHGAVLLGDAPCDRGAAPRRSALPLAGALAEPIRFTEDGNAAWGLDAEGAAYCVDLGSGREIARAPGRVPVAGDAQLDVESGRILRGASAVRWGVLEASCALDGSLLAGPGGVVWDLSQGLPLFTHPAILLGATVATAEGFTTVHWETGRGHHLDPQTGAIGASFLLPLADGDVVTGACEGPSFATALGKAFRVQGSQVHEIPWFKAPAPPTRATVGAYRYDWSPEGRLCCRPAAGEF